MAIRLANNCANCTNFSPEFTCMHHKVKVTEKHTCDHFNMQDALKNNQSCSTCSKYETSNCAHPDKAMPEMLCGSWAPNAAK